MEDELCGADLLEHFQVSKTLSRAHVYEPFPLLSEMLFPTVKGKIFFNS